MVIIMTVDWVIIVNFILAFDKILIGKFSLYKAEDSPQ